MVVAALVLSGAACNSAATSRRTDSTTVTGNDLAAARMGDSTSASGTDSAAAPSWALLPFTKVDNANPVLTPGKGRFTDPILHREIDWEEKDVFNPATVVKDGKALSSLPRAGSHRPSGRHLPDRIGKQYRRAAFYACRKHQSYILKTTARKKLEWEGGCEDPRVVEDEKGTCYMTYTAFDGQQARLLIATSVDLQHWTKHGAVFAAAYQGKYKDLWSKSGSIVSKV